MVSRNNNPCVRSGPAGPAEAGAPPPKPSGLPRSTLYIVAAALAVVLLLARLLSTTTLLATLGNAAMLAYSLHMQGRLHRVLAAVLGEEIFLTSDIMVQAR